MYLTQLWGPHKPEKKVSQFGMQSYARGLPVWDKSFSSLSLRFFNIHEDYISFCAQVLLFSNWHSLNS